MSHHFRFNLKRLYFSTVHCYHRRGSAVAGRLRGAEFESREGKKLSLLHTVQTGSGVHPTSFPMDTGPLSPGVKWQGRETDRSPPTTA
jgi:hypothetical protein